MRRTMRISAIPTVCLLYFSLICLPAFPASQNKSSTGSTMPAEFTATAPDIRALLNSESGSCKQANPGESLDRLTKALQALDGRGLVGDRALVEAALGSALTGQGKLEMASLAFQRALEDSKKAKNE